MTSQRIPRLAIIGCGAIAYFGHLPALRRKNWLPSVLVDTSPKRLDLMAKGMGRKGASVVKTSDWRSVTDQFDAAIVAVPHALHGPIGVELLAAGKHVLMEKPLAVSTRECAALLAAADTGGALLSVGLLRRHLSIVHWTRALLKSGVLGEIKHFRAREGSVLSSDPGSDAILHFASSGGGVLMDTGPHTLDFVQWCLGDVEPIEYADDGLGGVEADCVLKCSIAPSTTGSIVLSRTRNLSNTLHIEGTHGFVEVYLNKNGLVGGAPNALAFEHAGITPASMKPQHAADLFDAQISDFLVSTSTGRHVGVSGEEGMKSIALIEKCYSMRGHLVQPWSRVPAVQSAERDALHQKAAALQGRKILVTGASGFIGGRLVEHLVHDCGAQVRSFFHNAGTSTRVARHSVELIRGDFSNRDDVANAVKGVDYIFHCAYDPRSRKQNVLGLRHLIEAAAANQIQRLVHVSTFAVYEPFPDGALSEDTRDGDRSMSYVDTKLELEQLVFEAVKTGVPATIVQPSIVYGPYGKVWTNRLAEMLICGDVILPDQGDGLCNAVYVDDVVGGMVLAALVPAAIGERFILSGPEPVTWGTFYSEFALALGAKPPQYWPKERISERQNIIRNLRAAVSDPRQLIKKVVGWQPARAFAQAVLDGLPANLKSRTMNYYFGSGQLRAGQTFLPSKQELALFCSKAVTGSEKARSMLGYEPGFDLSAGMLPTTQYVRWAYADAMRLVQGDVGFESE